MDQRVGLPLQSYGLLLALGLAFVSVCAVGGILMDKLRAHRNYRLFYLTSVVLSIGLFGLADETICGISHTSGIKQEARQLVYTWALCTELIVGFAAIILLSLLTHDRKYKNFRP